MAAEAVATRRRIIPRPRLTKLLDESPARIKLLVAPAGYGKTTLAQQWLDVPERRDVWYRGGPASADVAALAAGIAIAAAEIVPDAGKRMRQRIRTVGHPEEDVDVLADLFAEDVQGWPKDAWLAIDDYHFAMESAASERFIDLLTAETSMRMVLTTRNRPSWASARRILYGELQEIDRRALAMEESEALELLGGGGDSDATALVQRARGWPAVLGIAAQADDLHVPTDDLPDQLYDYFAEELYRNADPPVRGALHRLSLVPSLSTEAARLLLGESNSAIIGECVRLGAVTFADEEVLLHPLLRTFLVKRLFREDPDAFRGVASESARFLIARGDWDAAFQVIAEHSVSELLVPLVSSGVDDLLAEGRTQTLTNWLDLAEQNHLSDPSLDFAEAEVAFRQARFAKAETLAAQAAATGEGAFVPRMLIRAGQSAVMDSRDEKGLEYFRAAQDVAEQDSDRLEADVGACFAALELGMVDEASEALKELSAMKLQGIDVVARKAIAQLVHSSSAGGLEKALDIGAAVFPLTDDVKNPLVATSFLHCYSHLLGVAANYVDALTVSERQISIAAEYRLDFALPHGCLVQAIAYCGLRDFAKAGAEIARAEEIAAGKDIHVAMQAAALRTRLALCREDMDSALSHSTRRFERAGSRSMMAEYLAYRALCYACLGDSQRSARLTAESRRLHRLSVEPLTVTACAEAVAAVVSGDENAPGLARTAYSSILSTGGFDTLVTASRACPALLAMIVKHENSRETLAALLSRSNDLQLGRRAGLKVTGGPVGPLSELTEREVEVAGLVAHGHTNRAIAERLFISESTVKVHVRHILRKLNANKRAEIAARVVPR
jgi:LuxR family transcriptional regulator, maltose regulon positive regulatory protein